jgi:titin
VKKSALFIYNLPNSTTFKVKMRAVNALGAGAASTTAKTVVTATKAHAPAVVAKYNAGKVTITYTNVTGANTGGTPITGYQYTLNGGANWITLNSDQKTANKVEVDLTEQRALNVQMRALNGLDGDGSTVIAIKAPETPSASVLAATGKVTVKVAKYSAAKTNNSSITKLQYSKDAGVTWTDVTWDGVADKSFDIAAVKGTSITAKVRAVNSAGISAVYTLAAATTK